jgi:hypothetical protein
MKKSLFLLLSVVTFAAYAQKKDLTTVNTVKPKNGQKMAFEAAYKLHVANFHKADEKLNVYEILSGPYAGYYHLVSSGNSFADFDKDRADANAHSKDLDKSFFPYLQETINGTYRYVDSLSLRPETVADKFVVTVRHLKMGLNMGDYRKELGRNLKIAEKLKGGYWENLSGSFYDQLWDGSDQTTVTVGNLKDGFKQLDADYYAPAPTGSPNFREEYIKTYSFEDWEKRTKLMEDAVVKTEVYIMKLRKDLSSQ